MWWCFSSSYSSLIAPREELKDCRCYCSSTPLPWKEIQISVDKWLIKTSILSSQPQNPKHRLWTDLKHVFFGRTFGTCVLRKKNLHIRLVVNPNSTTCCLSHFTIAFFINMRKKKKEEAFKNHRMRRWNLGQKERDKKKSTTSYVYARWIKRTFWFRFFLMALFEWYMKINRGMMRDEIAFLVQQILTVFFSNLNISNR